MRAEPAVDRAVTIATLFGQICRATPQEASDLSMMLTASERVDMALFCYARTHLREQGRSIAAACSPAILIRTGGTAGEALLQYAEHGGDTFGAAARPEKRRVSLAGR